MVYSKIIEHGAKENTVNQCNIFPLFIYLLLKRNTFNNIPKATLLFSFILLSSILYLLCEVSLTTPTLNHTLHQCDLLSPCVDPTQVLSFVLCIFIYLPDFLLRLQGLQENLFKSKTRKYLS